MAERMNGKAPFARRAYGNERRGTTPVPAFSHAERARQSHADRKRVQDLIREQHERITATPEISDLGNHELPAYKHKAELVANIEAHKAVIVGGETGSGKSTQLPQYLYEAGYDMTVMLVPRRIIADGLGERIRDELSSQIEDFNPEETVGIIHGERVERHEENKVLVMTPNTFIKMQSEFSERFGDKKLAIVADEIHEANLFTEIAVGVASLSVQKHEDWRLVAASATHNAATLEKPFQKLNNGYVPKVEIEGRPFNVELQEEPELTPMEAYARDGHAHSKSMIFTSGKQEISYIIEQTRKELDSVEKFSSDRVVFRMLHGELTEIELSHIDDPVPEGSRLVIVSSPAGMSGITIPGVTYVATDGTINRSELDDDKAGGLERRVLSKAGVTQQIGRAGRDVAGGIGVLCAPVLAKKDDKAKSENGKPRLEFTPFIERDEHEPPEIYSTNLERIVLSVASLKYNFSELNEFIPHPVQEIDIVLAEEALARIGALDDDGIVTPVGRYMDEFPIIPELARGLYEATRPGRSLQHKARAAFIAAAIDVGGLQDHRADEDAVKVRNQIIRHTSEDDLMVQLDLMTKLYERTDEEWDGYDFVERHGLHKKRVERVRKTARKVLSKMGIHSQNVIVTSPLPNEEQQIRNDFTAGFIDHVYADIGRATRAKQRIYRNIHGDESSTERIIDDRSAAKIDKGVLVAGMKRYYKKGSQKDGTPIKHDVIANVFEVQPAVVGYFAEQNGLVQSRQKRAGMVGERAVDIMQGTFGSIEVGVPVPRGSESVISPEAQEVLVAHVLSNPGKMQRMLRTLADDLEGYRNRTPAEVLAELRKIGAPADLTKASIVEMVRRAASEVSSAPEVEEKLRDYAYSSDISLIKYYDTESLKYLNDISPQNIVVSGQHLKIRYDAGQPFVTGLSKVALARASSAGPVYLEDGREVLLQLTENGVSERTPFGVSN